MKQWNVGMLEYWTIASNASFHFSTIPIFITIGAGRSPIKLTATHKEMAVEIGADKAAFLIEELETAHRAKLPPVFLLFLFWRFGWIHDGSWTMMFLVIELTSIDKQIFGGGLRRKLIIYQR